MRAMTWYMTGRAVLPLDTRQRLAERDVSDPVPRNKQGRISASSDNGSTVPTAARESRSEEGEGAEARSPAPHPIRHEHRCRQTVGRQQRSLGERCAMTPEAW